MKKIIYPELVGEIAKRGESNRSIAKLLGITDVSVGRKLSEKSEWTISEIEKLCDFFGKDYYELFKKNSN